MIHSIMLLYVSLAKLTEAEVFFFMMPISFQCSTTCGIGALWRTVVCSSENDEDCANMKRPEPARTCHLQPCATWKTGSWTKVSNFRCYETDSHAVYLFITMYTIN